MSNRLYTSIPAPKVPRNTFDRSRPNSLTMPFQRCVPTMLEEILPGDIFKVNPEVFARLQPMIAPVMNNMKISNHFFFVPLRTINKHFAEFMFNNRSGDYSDVLPYTYLYNLYNVVDALAKANDYPLAAEVIRFLDYIGIPCKSASNTSAKGFVDSWLDDLWNGDAMEVDLRVNILPFIAYTKIWSEYFRDENVEDDPFVVFEDTLSYNVMDLKGDVSELIDAAQLTWAECFLRLRPRAWAHDRFTSSLPFAQRGPDVLLPIAGTADVTYKEGSLADNYSASRGGSIVRAMIGYPAQESNLGSLSVGGSTNKALVTTESGASVAAALDPNGTLEVDFANADLTTTINAFRRAERLQRWYENSARGGIRPNEATLAHFGVKTPDSTLDRAEFLGGSMQPIVVSEVAQTSESTQSSPQATLAGKGTSYKANSGFRAYFTEHGYVFCFTSALVRANYWQGLPKVFSRMQRDEYYWPEFANLGEEPVFTKELFVGQQTTEDLVFGYVPRYSDYKSAVGELHGDMRSSLSFWTQAREFANLPQLNKEFLFGDPSLSPFAVQSLYSDPIIVTMQFHVKASRLMPFYGVPTI